MPDPRPLVAIERASGSVSEICRSGAASICSSRPASRFISCPRRAIFSFSRTDLGGQFGCRLLTIGRVELREVARHALLDLLRGAGRACLA